MNTVRSEVRAALALLRCAPGTLIYLVTLLVTQLTLNTVDERIGRRLLLSESTNLHNMEHAPVQVLIGSAFWTDTGPLVTYLSFVALLLVMVPAERWLGTGRWLVTFAAGHVGATLATLAVTGYAVDHGLLRPSIAQVSDVGVSYALFAAAGILTYRLPHRLARLGWVGAFLVGLVVALLLDHHVADLGHVCAFLIGLALKVLGNGRAPEPAPEPAAIPGSALLSRRAVVAGAGAGLVVAGAGATLAGCSTSTVSDTTPAAPKGPVTLGPAASVPVGGGTIFPAQRVVVTQPVAGTFHGLSSICTHEGCMVNEVTDGTIDCPCHGSQFGLDGRVVNGPADQPLPAMPVTIKDGQVVLTHPAES